MPVKQRHLVTTIFCDDKFCDWKESRKKNAKTLTCCRLRTFASSNRNYCSHFNITLAVGTEDKILRCKECLALEMN